MAANIGRAKIVQNPLSLEVAAILELLRQLLNRSVYYMSLTLFKSPNLQLTLSNWTITIAYRL